MEIYQLKSFVVIAREQNLTRAAEALHLSQSALSSQLKQLEGELGVGLFKRTTRGMTLTDRGRALLPHAQQVLEAAKQMREKAMALNRGAGESLTIGLNADPAFLRIGAINRRLSLLHADLNVIFLTSQTVNTAQMLRQGQIDLGFFYGDASDADIRHSLISRVRLCVVIPTALAAAGLPLDWPEVAALPWIWVGNDCPFYTALLDNLERHRLIPNQVVTTVDEHIVKELVIDGQGVAVMREDEARPLVESGRARIWEQGWMTLPLSLAWREKQNSEKKLRAATEVIRHVWQETGGEATAELLDKCWI